MATSQGKRNDPTPLAITTYAFIGLAIGSVTWNNAVVIARLHRWLLNKPLDDEKRVVEAALILVIALTFVGIFAARWGAKRGSVDATQIVWLMVAALLTATFAIIDHALPDPADSSKLPLWRTFYLLGWLAGLCLVAPLAAPFLLPSRKPANRSLYSVDLMAVLAALSLLTFLASEVLIDVANRFFGFSRECWLLNPSGLNVTATIIVVVTFLPIWQQELRSNRRSMAALLWIIFFVIFTIVYAGMYGPWFKQLDASRWQLFCVYASFTAVVLMVAFAAFLVPLRLRRFLRVALPLGMATGFAAIAHYGLVPLATDQPEYSSLVIAHAVNGALLGLVIAFWRGSKWWWGGGHGSERNIPRAARIA